MFSSRDKETMTNPSEALIMDFKTEPFKTEPVKTEPLKDHASSDKEDVVFLSATSRPSTLGRCACGSICNHASTTVSASAPAMTPIVKADHSSILGLGS